MQTRTSALTVKLIEPTASDSPVYLFARKGGGLHHLCFRCADLAKEIAVLKDKGADFIVPPQPGEAFENHEIAFFLANNHLNVELIDTTEKKGWRD